MPWYVYILQSQADSTYYKGSSERPLQRLQEHNAGCCQSTAARRPWNLVYVEELPSKKEMLIREKKVKRGHAAYFQQLINGEKNILKTLT
ncbi:MAG TPA: GIY-YIG nuclease family protein [Flavisolibacter sp.]|nr:GIY-YIG nuclease family protein [Flavisolibacter sp.]